MRALKQGQGTGVFEPQDLIRPTHVFGPKTPFTSRQLAASSYKLVGKLGQVTAPDGQPSHQSIPQMGDVQPPGLTDREIQ